MAGVNRIVRSVAPKTVLADMVQAISSSTNINQGDLCVFDTGTNVVRSITVGDDGTTCLGLAQNTLVNGKLVQPVTTDVSASSAISSVPGPVYGVVCKLVLHTGDTVVEGGLLYPDVASGSFHVTATAGALKAIGVSQQDITTASAGQLVEILLGSRYPQDTLKF